MEVLEGHLWTESFLRLISHSNDEKRLRALQQIILHNQKQQETKDLTKFDSLQKRTQNQQETKDLTKFDSLQKRTQNQQETKDLTKFDSLQKRTQNQQETKDLTKFDSLQKRTQNQQETKDLTKFDSLQKRTHPSQKTIKVKAIFPKHSLKNLDMDSFSMDGSLSTLNSSGDSPKSNQSLSKSKTFSNNNSPKFSSNNSPKFSNNNSPKFSNFKTTMSPIMGKWALLTKYNNILRNSNNDAEIVTKIVMEKFKNILSNYHRRSFMRKKTVEVINEDANFDKTIANTQLGDEDNTSDAKNDSSESTREDHLDVIYQNMDPLWEEDELLFELENATVVETEINSKTTQNEDLEKIISIQDRAIEPNLENEVLVAAQNVIAENTSRGPERLDEEVLFEEKIQYDARKFLETALGDELHNYSSVESNNDDNETIYPFSSNDNQSSSLDTTQISSLYKANLQPTSNSKASTLVREAAAQNQIILQTFKALNFCESSKQFKSSMEYIEAEKILLLALQKYEAVKKELHKVEYEELKDLGQVTIANLVFPVGEEMNESNEFSRWFFAIICCGSKVLATETIMGQNSDIRFEKSFNFENLDVDFEITISIYTLCVKNHIKNCTHDMRFQTKQETTTCPTPNKLIHFHKPNRPSKSSYSYERRNPSFTLWGTTTIRIADLTKPDPFKLTRIPCNATLKGIMTAHLSSNIEVTGTYSGFLTIGSEAGGFAAWNRRWCYLNGYELQFWNYPAEQELTEPIGSIDLRYCVASRITQVDRELCARPRTLLLETGRLSMPRDRNSLMVLCKSSYTITRHYLSADSHKDMTTWQKQLNSVVSALRNWNCMMCQLYFSR